MEVDTAGNLADNHPDHHTARPGIVVVIDKAHSDRYCIGMKTASLQTAKVAHLTDQFSSLEAKNRCNTPAS